jgi:hypothetical protein
MVKKPRRGTIRIEFVDGEGNKNRCWVSSEGFRRAGGRKGGGMGTTVGGERKRRREKREGVKKGDGR